MGRNTGKHVIISTKNRDWLKRECQLADASMSQVADNAISGLARMREGMPDKDWHMFLRLAAYNSVLREERGEDVTPPKESEGPVETKPDAM